MKTSAVVVLILMVVLSLGGCTNVASISGNITKLNVNEHLISDNYNYHLTTIISP